MESAETTSNQEAQMLPIFFITISRAGEIIDREELPARAFSVDEAHAFAAKMSAAHGDGAFERVILKGIPA